MARPLKQGLDYFPHDTDARNDKKVRTLRAVFGIQGYAVYMMLLEQIYQESSVTLNLSTTDDLKTVCKDIGIRRDTFLKIVNKCAELGLFSLQLWTNSRLLSSNGAIKRASVVLRQRSNWRENRIQTGELSPEITPQVTPQITPQETGESKVKESKRKEKEMEITPKPPVATTDDAIEQDSNLTAIAVCYEQNIGMIVPATAEALKTLSTEFPAEWFGAAVKEACDHNARRLSYVEAILERWKTEGFKSPRRLPGRADARSKGEKRPAPQSLME